MARTKQTARKSTGGKAPRQLQAAASASQFRSFMTGRQRVDHGTATRSKGGARKKAVAGGRGGTGAAAADTSVTSYLNYENMFYSYGFPTGARPDATFDPRLVAGTLRNPTTTTDEHWLGLTLNSKYDGAGMVQHGRPAVNLVVVLDISGSMSSSMTQTVGMHMFGTGPVGASESKLVAAKKCLHSIVGQLKDNDSFGLVLFNHDATVKYELQSISKIPKQSLTKCIDNLVAGGMTDLSRAAKTSAALFDKAPESSSSTNRLLFLTDLNSTVNSANDEAELLRILKKEANRNVYTSIVGIGMDLNVQLVEQISSTRGAKYLSVDSGDEFKRLMEKEFAYDVTVIAFNINVTVQSKDVVWVKGHGSPEINDIKKNKPAVLSSEFPCWQDEQGLSKGGIMVFKLATKTTSGTMPSSVQVSVKWDDSNGISHTKDITVDIKSEDGDDDDAIDAGLRKAVAIVHYVDLVNDYVMDQRKHKVKFLELFQGFRPQFLAQIEKSGDDTLKSTNQGDLELLDKIIALETPGLKAPSAVDQQDGCTPHSPFQGLKQRLSGAVSSVRSIFASRRPPTSVARAKPAAAKSAAAPARPLRPRSAAGVVVAAAAAPPPSPPARPTPKRAGIRHVQFAKPKPRSTAALAAAPPKTGGGGKRGSPVKARKAAGQLRRQAAKPKPQPKAAAAVASVAKAPSKAATTAAARGRTRNAAAPSTVGAKRQAGKAANAGAKKPKPAPKQSPKPAASRKRPAAAQLNQPATRKRTKRS